MGFINQVITGGPHIAVPYLTILWRLWSVTFHKRGAGRSHFDPCEVFIWCLPLGDVDDPLANMAGRTKTPFVYDHVLWHSQSWATWNFANFSQSFYHSGGFWHSKIVGSWMWSTQCLISHPLGVIIRIISWLVVWNMNFIFHSVGNNDPYDPNWRTHIFQRGRSATKQYIYI